MKTRVFKRDYVVRVGSTFSEVITLSDIWVTLEASETYTVSGGMVLASNELETFVITGALSSNNTILTISMASSLTSNIDEVGNYNYAIDISLSGVVQTILEGVILVKADSSAA